MKHQNINLFQDELKEKKEYLTAKEILIIVALVSVLMVVYSGYSLYAVNKIESQSIKLQSEVSTLSRTVSELATMVKPQEDSKLLAEARRLENDIRHLQALRNKALVPLDSAPPEVFLRAIARQVPDGMWFTSVYLAALGEDIILEGYVIQPELLPRFIETLGVEEALMGRTFHTIEILPVDPDFQVSGGSTAIRFFRMVAGCKSGCSLSSSETQ